MEKYEKIVPDTSIIIENLLSEKIQKKEIKTKEVIIHEAVLAELEHQANVGKTIGLLGLDELNKLKELSKQKFFELKYEGRRPNAVEIKHASLGEIDSLIRELAYNKEAVLITGDKVQSRVAQAKGMKVKYVQPVIKKKKIKIEKYFDKTTMSVHLREKVRPYAKKGMPGNWKTVYLSEKKLKQSEIIAMSKEIIEESKIRSGGFLEIERRGSSVVQLENYRIVITRPPFSDGWEITAVRPVKKLNIKDYDLSEKLLQRIEDQAEGILVAGSPGEGKSTFASALAEFYAKKDKTVKTIEAPRDLQLDDTITQYSISQGSSQEIHDVLLLSRPDYTVFDEMRNNEDFRLFSDLRLSGIGIVGVLHSTNPVDAIQRFIGRTELGVIPQIVDTVVFIKNGKVGSVLSLQMTVKVPSGMTEADLARPVVEIKDFENDKLKYEIYSYGEETVVVPVVKESVKPLHELSAKFIEKELSSISRDIKAEILSDNKAIIYVPESLIARIIGKEGKNIEQIEKRLGINIKVESLKGNSDKKDVKFNLGDTGKFIIFYVDTRFTGDQVDVHVDDTYLFSSTVGKKGDIKVHKKSKLGRNLLNLINRNREIKLFV
ncbi:PINc/VapC family ATPase [archaeon]|nr:PINc/VapC family ATPase [archaeon]